MASHLSSRLSLGPFTAKSPPATAGVEKLYPVTVSNLSLSSSGSLPWCSKAHLPTSAPFRARPPGRHPAGYPRTTAWSSGILAPGSRHLSAAGIRLLGILSRRGIAPLLRSAYRVSTTARTPTGFPRSAHTRHDGVGVPFTRDQRCSHDRLSLPGRRVPPLPTARPYHPGPHPVVQG
jgi:hypothetical protein